MELEPFLPLVKVFQTSRRTAYRQFMGRCPKPHSLIQYFASQSNLRLVGHLPDYPMKKVSQKLSLPAALQKR